MKITNPESQGFSAERLNRVTDCMNQYVNAGKVAGIVTLVARRGEVVHLEKCGYQNIKDKKEIEFDTLFRIYSMTKPICSVAFMMLYERGLVRLEDPVSKFVPEFKNVKVLDRGGGLVSPIREITVHHLLTHTAGFSYGDDPEVNLIDRMYAEADLYNPDYSNEDVSRRIAALPLRYHPGEAWHYSFATDVVGHLIELISGKSLSDFLSEDIFKPLGLRDTFFRVPKDKISRLSELYGLTEEEQLGVVGPQTGGDYHKVRRDSAGHGLVSTVSDYLRFCQLILNKGELDGVRLLSPKTVELMRINHLPVKVLPLMMSNLPWLGIGFGLGFSVLMDVAQSDQRGSLGSHGWGGWASTHFWIDPVEEIIGILLLQYVPSGTYPITYDLRNAVYQALME
jgi:CubicO group peptidase (beta-lactamase class C family)